VGPTLITLAFVLVACQRMAGADATSPTKDGERLEVEQLTVRILAAYPHDPTAFTQGLVWDGGLLYESTGLYGRSTVRRVEPGDGRILEKTVLDPNLFGEGLALAGGRLIQLTWKAGIALVYDLATLRDVDQFGYNGEGWGLASDGERLAMSNGSSLLTFRDPSDFRWLSTLEVRLAGEPIDRLNELEFADGQLYANVWGENRIVRIDPQNGRVTAVIDAAGLLKPQEARMVDVLNGIAYDPASETFWLTGKFWPKTFQVVFVPKE
jgi:glutaminyl-peptide cyclotransferase